MTVTQLAKRLSISADTVRHYVRCGLLNPKRNPENDYKVFASEDVQRLSFILQCKALGFSLQDIQTIMSQSMSGQSPCPQVREIMSKRLSETQQKIQAMQQTYEHMKQAMEKWQHQGDCLPTGEHICHLIEGLSQHNECAGQSTLEKKGATHDE